MRESDKKFVVLLICKFIHKEKILEKFCHNSALYHDWDVKHMKPRDRTLTVVSKSLDKLLGNLIVSNTNIRYIVSEFFISCASAFPWDTTPEGSDFWSEVSDKWSRYIRNSVEIEEMFL